LSALILPAAAKLTARRLIVVGDGPLQAIPFAALTKGASDAPLVQQHEIVSLASAATLSLLRSETTKSRAPTRTLAVLADPVFGADDPRVAGGEGSVSTEASADPDDLTRSATEAGVSAFPRLIGSRREAAQILKWVPASDARQAVDFDASRATATSAELADYRIIHFATHGLVNNVHPQLSGIVLSLVDRRGRPQDGFLRLHDIYNLELAADLVVLSACQTALGKDVRGEGLVGLARGFMFAGAPRVVASLWKVDDRASAELMSRFYEGMLGPRRLSPSAALRAAQLGLASQPRWRAPYYWAAFVLQGEWK
jgi:CHAT domain-containing protein